MPWKSYSPRSPAAVQETGGIVNREDRRYAVLIDADNVSDKYVKIILDEISNYGVATYKRIYGDWTKP